MPSPVVEKIIANYQKKPGLVLALSPDLSDADLAALTAAANAFSSVEELQVHHSSDGDWTSGRFTAFAVRLAKLSWLDLRISYGLTDTGLRAIADKLTALNTLNLTNCDKVTDVGVKVTADKIVANIRQQLPPSASKTDELKAILQAALEELAKEELKPKSRAAAEEAVKNIEKEMTDPEPDGTLVEGWLGTIDRVSKTVGNVIRSAAAIGALFT